MSAARDWSRCHLCGSAEVRPDSPSGSPTCADCWPITEHVVSMQTGHEGASIAVCPCGWRAEAKGDRRSIVREAKVRLHWRDVIRRKRVEFDAAFGPGAAASELKAGAIAIVLLGVNLVGWLVVAGAAA